MSSKAPECCVDLSDPLSINSKDMFQRKYKSCTELKSLLPLSSRPGYSFSRETQSGARKSKSQHDLLKNYRLQNEVDKLLEESESGEENVIRIYFKTPPSIKRIPVKDDIPIMVTHVNPSAAAPPNNHLERGRYKPLESWRINIHQTVKCTHMQNDENKIMNGTSRLFVNKDEIIYKAGVYHFREETPPFQPRRLKERSQSTMFF